MKKKNTTIIFVTIITIAISFIFSVYQGTNLDKSQSDFNKNYSIYPPIISKNINFCGEKTPIEYDNIKERLDREILINTFWQSQTLLFIKKANKYFGIIEPIIEKYNIPNDFKYLSLAESGLSNVISPSGATGYWQIMKTTGLERGLEINFEVDERYHIEKSTNVACKYLLEAYEKFNSWTLAAASYNMGIRGLKNQMSKQKVNNYYDLLLNDETSRYIFRIIAIKEIIENQKKYGFHLKESDLYTFPEFNEIILDSSITDFADYSNKLNINYKILKEFNPWLRQSYLKNIENKKYMIKIPKINDYTSN